MTTHYEKIQALGNRMASNLETMGVSASFSDGGLTLADKILQIQHFTDGLLLWGDKDIIQTGDTVNFCALLLDDKKGVSGETIVFYDSNSVPISYDTSGIHTINKNLGKSFMVHYEGDTELQFYDESNTGYSLVYKANKSLEITSSGSSQITWNNVEWVKMVNGVLSDNNGNSFDLSSLVTNVILMHLVGTGSVYFDVVGVGVTDSNGVATVSYTGKGTGLLNIKAITTEGIIQSETFIVLDAIFYDQAITGHKNTNWTIPSNLTESVGDDGTTLTSVASSSSLKRAICCSLTGNWEAQITLKSNGNVRIGVQDTTKEVSQRQATYNDWTTLKVQVQSGTIEFYVLEDDEWIGVTASTNNADLTDTLNFMIYLYNTSGDDRTVTFKEVKIYPI